MNIVLLGPPGAGKGFQANLISKKLKIPTISTGDLLRERIKLGDDDSKILASYVNSGELVPDELIGKILKERVKQADCAKGFILDGFPRSLSQAEILDKLEIAVDKVIEIDVDEEIIIARLKNRIICKKCGAVFNRLFKKPKVEGCCDLCGGELVARKDDDVATIKNRLQVFNKETKPLVAHYKSKNIYHYLNGNEGSVEVERKLLEIIGDVHD